MQNETKIALPSQYYMSFTGKDAKFLYILVSINLHIGNYIICGHCVCDLLDYNTVTCWNCYDDTITKYSGYPNNVNYNLSKYN